LATHWPFKVPPQQQPLFSKDKLLHFSAYAGLAFLFVTVAQIRRSTIPGLRRRPLPIAALWLLAVTAGFLDEITQPLTARDFEWWDWVADILGATAGIFFGIVAGRRFWPVAEAYEDSRPEPSP
jgi:VanZ family protein